MSFKPKSYKEIYNDTMAIFKNLSPAGCSEPAPGSMLWVMIEMFAQHQATLYAEINDLRAKIENEIGIKPQDINYWHPTLKAQVWTYPDGTQSATEPADGTRFMTHHNAWKTEWAWDGLQQQWHRLADYQAIDFITVNITVVGDECECGNKQNPVGQGHSHWCKLFKQEF